ncbi:MAG: hypothetical protein RSD62_04470, partial [Ruthenibacterium sp.]
MDYKEVERLNQMRDAQCGMRTLLGYTTRENTCDTCPVCGAPLYDGTAVYESDDGEMLGCAACINVRY